MIRTYIKMSYYWEDWNVVILFKITHSNSFLVNFLYTYFYFPMMKKLVNLISDRLQFPGIENQKAVRL